MAIKQTHCLSVHENGIFLQKQSGLSTGNLYIYLYGRVYFDLARGKENQAGP